MKLVMTLSILLMTTAVFAQQKRSMRAQVGERTQTVERLQSGEKSELKQAPVKGVVRMKDGACGLRIEVLSDAGATVFFPVNLPEDFKVDGKSILFNYRNVDPKLKSECVKGSSVIVSNVKPRRVEIR